MNNTQSLPIIFWCFIVLITCCFSLHLRPDPPRDFCQTRNGHTLSALALLDSTRLIGVPFVLPFSMAFFFLSCFGIFRLSQFLLNYMSVSVEFIFVHNQKNNQEQEGEEEESCENYMYYFYATFLDPFASPNPQPQPQLQPLLHRWHSEL